MHSRTLPFLLLILLPLTAFTQRQLGSYWFRDMAEIPRMSPYDMLDMTGFMVFPRYDPVLTIGESDVVYLWRPEYAGLTRRMITRFNLFMEPVWEVEFDMEREEDIFYFSEKNDTLMVLTVLHESREKMQQVMVTYLEPDSGAVLRRETLATFFGGTEAPLFFTTSASKDRLLFFQLRRESGDRRVIYYTDYLNNRGELAFQARRMDEVLYSVFSPDLTLLDSRTISLDLDKKAYLLDVTVDDAANLYFSSWDKPGRLQVEMISANGEERRTLATDEFPRPDRLRYLYETGFPPYVLEPGQVYIPMATRIERGKNRGIKRFELVHMDFTSQATDVSHEVNVTSSLLVALEKSREDINSRRMRYFDQFVIRDVHQTPGNKVWMVTQFFAHDNFRGMATSTPNSFQSHEQLMGELVIFVFDSVGEPEQAIIVPSSNSLRSVRDRTCYYADLHYTDDELQILIREDSGDKYRGPARLYLRRVNLETGNVSPRQLIYEPDRRTLHTPFAFAEWINKDILQFMSYEGDDERIYGISINLAMPPLTEEEAKELQSHR